MSAVTRSNESGAYLRFLFFCIINCILLAAVLAAGCSHGPPDEPVSLSANELFAKGDYEASLGRYEKLIEKEPKTADRVLFEMGIIYAHPANQQKNYFKALEYFNKIISDYPDSEYRRDSQMMMLQIQNVIIKDRLIAEQQNQINSYRQGMKTREHEIESLQDNIEILERKVFDLRTEPVDQVLIEKQKRRLTLISRGGVIKIYTIALGGNPVGPKEREGDNKTPEGHYIIESRNMHSDYHLSLRISYPNEKDIARARALGVSPGGDIMIHGIKNGLSWVGRLHTGIDWTEGCIAVTNEEMEEIVRLVPDGTPVEIRP